MSQKDSVSLLHDSHHFVHSISASTFETFLFSFIPILFDGFEIDTRRLIYKASWSFWLKTPLFFLVPTVLHLLVCLPFSEWRFLEPWTSHAEAWILLLKTGLLSSTIRTFRSFPSCKWNQLLWSLLLQKLMVVRFSVETAGNQSPRLA